jgi:Xaa-Pro aminopeptidase
MTRAEKLSGWFPEEAGGIPVDAALITSLPNRRYLSGFPSSAGFVLITRNESYCIVDFRYYEAAQKAVKDLKVVLLQKASQTLPELLRREEIRGVMLECEGISLAEARRLGEIIREAGAQCVLDETLDGLLWRLRSCKTNEEMTRIRESQKITEEAYQWVLPQIREGITERELALEIEYRMRRLGAEGVAFDLIVVAGKNGSLCHGVPGENPIRRGDFITMDIGALLDGYHSDMTRTVALGHVGEEQKTVYNTVLRAQLQALDMVAPGVLCGDVDKAARDLIDSAGYQGRFGHSTGHAVGLEIHERPSFSPGSQTPLSPGMVMTVEPGIYLPGKFGVRIEDMVAVTEEGCVNLTQAPKELVEL